MAVPLFPKLMPKLIDSEWLNVDQPCDDESEVSQLEREHQAWLLSIQQRNMDLLPIGKTQAENLDEEEEEDDEDDNDDDDESETHDEEDEDEIEVDAVDVTERNSPVDVNIRMGPGHGQNS